MVYRVTLSLAVALLAGSAIAADELKSGPQVGDGVPGRFNPLWLNGDFAGRTACPVWVRGYNLVALIFAREVNDPLTGLVKSIDKQMEEASAQRNDKIKLGVFVVFCNDDPDLKVQLQTLLATEKFKHVVVCTHSAAGPSGYEVAKEADTTVVIFRNSSKVAVNWALKKGELIENRTKEMTNALSVMLRKK